MSEFNLSEKRIEDSKPARYWERDIKEFIARVKKIIIDTNKEHGIKTIGFGKINKLAGKDLI